MFRTSITHHHSLGLFVNQTGFSTIQKEVTPGKHVAPQTSVLVIVCHRGRGSPHTAVPYLFCAHENDFQFCSGQVISECKHPNKVQS